MNIGIITYSIKIGGVETVIETLSKNFISQGHSVEIIETVSKGEQSDSFRNKGFNVHTILIDSFETKNDFAIRLATSLYKYDVLILNAVPFVHNILGLLKAETVVLPILHNDISDFYDTVVLNRKQWDKVICVSYALEKKLKKLKNLDSNEVTTILNGIDVDKTFPQKIEKKSKKIEIIYVGRIEDKQKGVLLLPQIIKKVVKNIEDEIVLKIIGNGPSLSRLKKESKELEVDKYISFLGEKSHGEVLKNMRESDILIMPSYYEGLGLVYLEAMAQGVIPLASNLKDNTDLIISHGENGFLCEIGDVDCFAQQIISIVSNRKDIESISYKAWETAYNSLSVEIMTQNYLSLIDDVINSKITTRSKEIKKIPFGNLPYILTQIIDLNIRVKNKFLREINLK